MFAVVPTTATTTGSRCSQGSLASLGVMLVVIPKRAVLDFHGR